MTRWLNSYALMFLAIALGLTPATGFSQSLEDRALELKEEKQFGIILNQFRIQKGLNPLKESPELKNSSYDHACWLAQKGLVVHWGPKPWNSSSQRMRWAGYHGHLWLENVAGGECKASSVFEQWLNSEAHYQAMISAEVEDYGISIVKGEKFGMDCFSVLNLGARKSEPEQTASPPSPSPSSNIVPASDLLESHNRAELELFRPQLFL